MTPAPHTRCAHPTCGAMILHARVQGFVCPRHAGGLPRAKVRGWTSVGRNLASALVAPEQFLRASDHEALRPHFGVRAVIPEPAAAYESSANPDAPVMVLRVTKLLWLALQAVGAYCGGWDPGGTHHQAGFRSRQMALVCVARVGCAVRRGLTLEAFSAAATLEQEPHQSAKLVLDYWTEDE